MFQLRREEMWDYLRRLLDRGLSKRLRNIASNETDPADVIGDPFLPPLHLRRRICEPVSEWYRWSTEFVCYLKMLCGLNQRSQVLEIGCNVGRNTYSLRSCLSQEGSYCGFDLDAEAIAYLQNLYAANYPHFRFVHADLHNTHYNPSGKEAPDHFRFPYKDASFDIVLAASIFTHMKPTTTAHYFHETARTLKPGGYFLCTFFVREYYGGKGASAFGEEFEFEYGYPGFEDICATHDLNNPELLTAYSLAAIKNFAQDAGLKQSTEHLHGRWSGKFDDSLGDQEIFVFRLPAD